MRYYGGWVREASGRGRGAHGMGGECQPCIKRGVLAWGTQFAALGTSPPSSASLPLPIGGHSFFSVPVQEERRAGLMASNYVDTAAEEGRFHGHYHHSTTPTSAAAASPKQMRRSWSSASSGHGHGHGHGAAPKCVCAPATHAGSFKCRLHRSSSHGHGHPATPPSPATSAAPPPAVPPPSSRTVAAQ